MIKEKIKDKTLLDYGFLIRFNDPSVLTIVSLFESIPIYPEVITLEDLAKKYKTTKAKVGVIIQRLPVLAPVIEIDDYTLSRVK